MIKMRLFLSLAVMGLIALIGCSNSDSVSDDPELTISTETLTVLSSGDTETIHIKTNSNWTISSSETWCSVSPSSGESGTKAIEVTTEANTETTVRTATLTVNSGGLTETITVTQNENYILIIEQSSFDITSEEQEVTVNYTRSDEVDITIDSDWISLQETKSEINDTQSFVVDENTGLNARTGTISFTLEDITETVTITQSGKDISIEADETGVESTAAELAAKIGVGWNVGNSLEVPDGETAWGNPAINEDLIKGVKAAGFTAIRIPCAWDSYVVDETTYEISDTWLARVKEVVDYCINNDMYAMINIHWDGGWLEDNPVYEYQDEINEEQEALWKQIAVYFRDYDEHLLFAGTNEVHADYGTPTTENLEVQQSFNQTFVDAVRATGGKNAYRNLIVQTYNTNIAHGVNYHKMPTDVVEDRLMLEVHYYDPWDFCGQTSDGDFKSEWGKDNSDISSWGQEDYLTTQFTSVKEKFVDNGIPVILGEYGALLRSDLTGETLTKHIASHNYYLKTVTQTAIDNGMIPFVWDNGVTGNDGFGLFNRTTGEQVHEDAIDAIVNSGN